MSWPSNQISFRIGKVSNGCGQDRNDHWKWVQWLSTGQTICGDDSWVFRKYVAAWLQVFSATRQIGVRKVSKFHVHMSTRNSATFCYFLCTRLLWYFALSIALVLAVYIFLTALDEFSSKPAFTALKSVKHPIWKVPFPAVAICSVNKISKRGARDYAEYL